MVLSETLNLSTDDTIIAPATSVGTGAVTIIRMSGPKTFDIADKLIDFRKGTASDSKGGRVKFGVIHSEGEILDEVLCSIFRAPHSYTGEDCVEISCHASSYIADSIVRLACEEGARIAYPGEFTKRAFLHGKMDLAQAEAVADIIASGDKASHDIAMKQLRGGVSDELRELRTSLLNMTALMELELDFSEEDVEFADRSKLREMLDSSISKIRSLADSFRQGNAIKNGIPVAIVGAPNSGKSTLLNAIIGEQRAIVSDIAGTTRDTIEECFVADGIRFRLVDTAGIRHSEDTIEKIGIERSFDALRKADFVIVLVDASEMNATQDTVNHADKSAAPSPDCAMQTRTDGITPQNPDCAMQTRLNENTPQNWDCASGLTVILKAIDFSKQTVLYALNKADLLENDLEGAINNFVIASNTLVNSTDLQEHKECIASISENTVLLSAKTGESVKTLLQKLSAKAKSKLNALSEDATLITNARHHQALLNALEALTIVRSSLDNQVPTDLLAEDLRTALSHLGSITGEISTDEVLGEIFGRFCIGK